MNVTPEWESFSYAKLYVKDDAHDKESLLGIWCQIGGEGNYCRTLLSLLYYF